MRAICSFIISQPQMREEEKVADAAERRNLTQFSSFKNKKKWKERHVQGKNKL